MHSMSVSGFSGSRRRRQQVDPGIALERCLHRQELPWLRQIAGHVPAPCDRAAGGTYERSGLFGDIPPARAGTVPFEHREFGMVPGRPLAVAEDAGELEDALHPRRQQFFHREFGRGMQIDRPARAMGFAERGFERRQMRLHPRRDLQRRRFDLDIAAPVEKLADGFDHVGAADESIRPVFETVGMPPCGAGGGIFGWGFVIFHGGDNAPSTQGTSPLSSITPNQVCAP
jgi:hypothetical protein